MTDYHKVRDLTQIDYLTISVDPVSGYRLPATLLRASPDGNEGVGWDYDLV